MKDEKIPEIDKSNAILLLYWKEGGRNLQGQKEVRT